MTGVGLFISSGKEERHMVQWQLKKRSINHVVKKEGEFGPGALLPTEVQAFGSHADYTSGHAFQ